MKFGLEESGGNEIFAKLVNTAKKVPDHARRAMHSNADIIVKEAKLNTPVDKHNLEESIRKVIKYENRGRLSIEIVMGGIVNGVNVDEYALEIHEHYDSMGTGPGTQAKREANPGRYIGEKFLERAVEERREALYKYVIEAVMNAVDEDWDV